MFKNYLKTAWRNLVKNRAFSIINILGLTLGLTCSLLIMLWVHDERSINAFHELDDRLYTVFERQYHDGIIDTYYNVPGLLAEELKTVFPEVEFASGMGWNELATFEFNGKILKEDGNNAGPDFFKMFSYPLLAGDANSALKDPVDIAISRKMAEDFFGSPEEAMGKSIRYQNTKDLKVSAVFENITHQSSRKFDFIINWETFLEMNKWARDWGNNSPDAYVVLKKDADVESFRKKILHFIDNYNKQENFRIEFDIQKYSEQYLHSKFESGKLVGGQDSVCKSLQCHCSIYCSYCLYKLYESDNGAVIQKVQRDWCEKSCGSRAKRISTTVYGRSTLDCRSFIWIFFTACCVVTSLISIRL